MKPDVPMVYPSHNDANKYYNWMEHGMTLRDYFAIRIFTKLMELEGKKVERDGKNGYDTAYEYAGAIAGDAYRMADEMVAERECK